MSQLTVQQSYLLCWELLPDRNRKSMGLWYWELMSHPDPAVLPVGTLHSLEWFWVSRRILIHSHHNTFVFFPKTSVRLFVCPLTFHVSPVAPTVQDGFFPYLVQMINSMRGCVVCDDPLPWPISSRSFGKSCPLCSVYSSGWILFIFGTNDHYH